MSIYDPLYKKEDFEIKLEIKSNSAGENNNSNQLTFFRLDPKFFIAAGDGIDVNRLMHQIHQEKAKAEAEAKRVAEEKAAREKAEQEKQAKEKAEKERLEREEEERKKKEGAGGNNPPSEPQPVNPKKPIKDGEPDKPEPSPKDPPVKEPTPETPPMKPEPSPGGSDGGSDGTPKKPGGSTPNPPKKPGEGGGIPKPPKPPRPGERTPLSVGVGNEYYLGSLYGTKPFSAQESSAFNSTIISNELSALQPITSLNVAGLPVNDTAIKTEQFGA